MNTELARAYIRFAHADEGSAEFEANFWASDAMLAASMSEPERVWAMIKQIIEQDSTLQVMQILSAGPLEEALVHHGPAMIDAIEDDVVNSAKLRELLGGVWRSDIDERVWKRIEAIRHRRW